MKLSGSAYALLLAAAGSPALAHASAPQACQAVDSSIVEQQFDRFNGALASRNPDTVTALFTANAVLLPTLSNLPRTNPAAVRDYFVHFLAKAPSGRIDTSTLRIGCNEAERFGTWTWTLTDPATGVTSKVPGRYSFVYRASGGDWKIDHLHSSLMPEKDTRTASH